MTKPRIRFVADRGFYRVFLFAMGFGDVPILMGPYARLDDCMLPEFYWPH